jgi:hypothetical protein
MKEMKHENEKNEGNENEEMNGVDSRCLPGPEI